MATRGPSSALLSAMSELWQLLPPGPENILAHPAFQRLREACRDGYSNSGTMGPGFALSNALRALGLPCGLQKETTQLSLPVQEATRLLDAMMRATSAKRVHLVPLDLAADLPPLAFGSATVGRPTAEHLRVLVDWTKLKRLYPREDFDVERFAQFNWLIIEEIVPLDREPEARAVPMLFMDIGRDFGQIDPHRGERIITLSAIPF